MGMALSDSTIVYQTGLRADSKANLLTDLHSALTLAGWPSSVYLTGHVYTLTSPAPQSLSVYVRIWDPADGAFPDCIALQMVSFVDGLKVGIEHHIKTNAGGAGGTTSYYVVANICQMFLGQPGVYRNHWISGEDGRRAVALGVPFVLGPVGVMCTDVPDPAVTTEAWWSCSDEVRTTPTQTSYSKAFRNKFYCCVFSACHNGTVHSETDVFATRQNSALQLMNIKPARNQFVGSWPSGIQWYGTEADGSASQPLGYEPLIGWAGNNIADAPIIGQLYDALLVSQSLTVDSTYQSIDTSNGVIYSWINYLFTPFSDVDDGRVTALFLLTGISGASGAYAY